MRRVLIALGLTVTAGLLALVANADDDQIARQIIQQLQQEKQAGNLRGFDMQLKVEEGTAWVKGRVANSEQKDLVLGVAQRTPGVKQVVNDLTVAGGPAMRPLPQADGALAPQAPPQVAAQPMPQMAPNQAPAAQSAPAQNLAAKPQQPSLLAGFGSKVKTFLDGAPEQASAPPAAAQNAAPRANQPQALAQAMPTVEERSSRRMASPEAPEMMPHNAPAQLAQAPVQPMPPQTMAAQPAPAQQPMQFAAAPQAHMPAIAPTVGHHEVTAPDAFASVGMARKSMVAPMQPASGAMAQTGSMQPAVAQAAAARAEAQTPTLAAKTGPTAMMVSAPLPPAAPAAQADAAAAAQAAPQGQMQYAWVPAYPQQMYYGPQPGYGPPPGYGAPPGYGPPQGYAAQAAYPPSNTPLAFAASSAGGPQQVQQAGLQQAGYGQGGPIPTYVPGTQAGVRPARYDHPHMPGYSWPSYASYPNSAAVTYPKQYSPSAWPYIGPFYPYPQVPLGWRHVTLEWDDGWWMLDFKDRKRKFP